MGFFDCIKFDDIRNFCGTVFILICIIFIWCCIYKYAVCQDNRNQNSIRNYDIKHNRNQMIIINII